MRNHDLMITYGAKESCVGAGTNTSVNS